MKVKYSISATRRGMWGVRKHGCCRCSKIFFDYKDAIEYARKMCSKHGGAIYIHRRDGSVESREEF
jgi:hypothetical protein